MKLFHVSAICLLTALVSGCLTNPNQPPNLLRGDALVYPDAARAHGLEGMVVVRYTVLADGRVSDAQIISAQPEGVFDEAALMAVRGWRFRPGRRKGVESDFVGLTSTLEFKFGEAGDYPTR